MLSRISLSSARLWQSSVKNRLLLGPVSSQSTAAPAAPAAPAKAAPAAAEESEASSYPDGMIFNPPNPPVVVKETVASLEELRGSREPLEDQLRVWFGKDMPTINDEKNPERDLVNFPRFNPAATEPGKVRCVIIPETWFTYFYDKTGVTGPYMFGAGFLTFLLSKEFLIIEHEMVVGASLAFIAAVAIKKFKDPANKYMEGIIDQERKEWKEFQEGNISALDEFISLEKSYQSALKNQKILFDAKRENVHLQREAEYRRRQMSAYEEVKRKLDYQIASQMARKQFAQNHMVSWIIDNVQKGITPQQEKEALNKCISDLKTLSASKHAAI